MILDTVYCRKKFFHVKSTIIGLSYKRFHFIIADRSEKGRKFSFCNAEI